VAAATAGAAAAAGRHVVLHGVLLLARGRPAAAADL
jgi:hypothetical protein